MRSQSERGSQYYPAMTLSYTQEKICRSRSGRTDCRFQENVLKKAQTRFAAPAQPMENVVLVRAVRGAGVVIGPVDT